MATIPSLNVGGRPAHHRRGPRRGRRLAELPCPPEAPRSSDSRHNDLVQKGRIAIWQAYDRHQPGRGALPSWLTRHATMHQRLQDLRRTTLRQWGHQIACPSFGGICQAGPIHAARPTRA
ncbi:sigma factor [Streptomyces sp. NPDC057557]|uniref:sigma factor n=1 Tax=Streptomyces sp. NPDC057557 TaxID=3346167 RepID=UPI00368399A8